MSIKNASKTIPEKVFRDPVHDYIHIQHQVILDLINSSEMQRLRRIKQLGTSAYTFHGAEHSRFGHSLGVYEIARRICDKFVRNYPSQSPGDGGWDDRERLLVLCAALLHDIGHGAFSHTFEKIFATDHEQVTINIILSEDTEVHQILAGISPDFPSKVAAVIDKTYDNPQVVQLISSQIDADRMDYLLRDSYYTGTHYGTFDLTRILRVIRPAKKGVIFNYAGMHAVEDYIVSRYQMYMQVYFHPVSRSMEALLAACLQRARDLYQDNPKYFKRQSPFLVPFFTDEWQLSDYLRLDDSILATYLAQWLASSDDAILCDLTRRFINRQPFKSVSFKPDQDQALINQLTGYVADLGYQPKYYTAITRSLDLPYDFYRPRSKRPRTEITLLEKNGNLIELSQCSHLVAALTGQVRGDNRLHFPSELYPGKNQGRVNLFQPLLDQIHGMVENGTIQAVPPEQR
ncbi:hypothetical protein AWM75_03970 [Aerococcus urinaehominis]|uniref:Uncharacterized protein n=1 Tax=Aerococcus urinaehominis TaxID=128944 RepID=A0A0X8FKX0_9LACT|nr:HD domain-containing protein [Aerococcus urinaehominis]AMB99213.1 hypothetical protein AWM75_03970 [Aerococcus urinaehominis]SDM32180.1 hypothetical protein SAMN04487985_11244 [Aerococcus urinaehominis]